MDEVLGSLDPTRAKYELNSSFSELPDMVFF